MWLAVDPHTDDGIGSGQGDAGDVVAADADGLVDVVDVMCC